MENFALIRRRFYSYYKSRQRRCFILDAFANCEISFVMSVRPLEKARLPLDTLSRNLIFEDFLQICQGNSRFITI